MLNPVYFAKEKGGIGEIKDEATAFEVGFLRAKELTSLGINVVLAPVLDLVGDPGHFLYGRSLGQDAKKVSSLGAAIIRGQKAGGIISAAKHFPGHGVSDVDSHKALPEAKMSLRELSEAHLLFIEELLRKTLGFSGVLITDDLEMGAVSKTYTIEDAVVAAVQAGADMLIIGGNAQNQRRGYDALLQAVRSGKISEERLDKSVARILRLKHYLE